MKFAAESTQRLTRIEALRVVTANVDGTASSTVAELPEGYTRASVAVATHVYTFVFAQPFARIPVVSVTCLESGTGVSYIPNLSSVTTTGFVLRCENDASTAGSPAGFHILVVGSDTTEQV